MLLSLSSKLQKVSPGFRAGLERLDGQPAGEIPTGRIEVLDGALAVDPGQQARRGVLDRPGNQSLDPPGSPLDPLQISVPEAEGQIHVPLPDRLAIAGPCGST